MSYLKVSLGIFIALSASRFIPHPPNFTSLLALSFYVPTLLGIRYLPVLIVSFALTDLILGFHNTVFFTWGSILIIGFISNYFKKNIISRIGGALLGALLFYIITNFGVWTLGTYGFSMNGLVICYTLALPFFAYSLISTFIFSGIIEGLNKINLFNLKISK